ncbi:uncharacterized protein TNCV_4569551 [Trichonephila clavipes]|nr:uncharacterized protein TNCV_4569551 [Trichonephila clavipes]
MLDLILSGLAKPSLYVYTDRAKVLIWTDEMVWTYVLNCHEGTRIEMEGYNWNDGFVVVGFTRTQSWFLYNMEQEYDEYVRAFISKYVSEENGLTLTPDARFDMVINQFIRNFTILKVHTPNMSVHSWTTRLDDERLVHTEHFSTVAYLEMKCVRNPRSEGKRIFRNLMDLPPLDNMRGGFK